MANDAQFARDTRRTYVSTGSSRRLLRIAESGQFLQADIPGRLLEISLLAASQRG